MRGFAIFTARPRRTASSVTRSSREWERRGDPPDDGGGTEAGRAWSHPGGLAGIRGCRRLVSRWRRGTRGTRASPPTPQRETTMQSRMMTTLAALPLAALAACQLQADAIDKVIPAPAVDTPAAEASGPQTAALAGGCFWGVQGMFEHRQGVTKGVAGYSGGS